MTIKEYEPIAPLTTLKVGGSARYVCEVSSLEDVTEAIEFAKRKTMPIFVLGGGSNIVFRDGTYEDAVVVRMNVLGRTVIEEDKQSIKIAVAAGESWDELVAHTCKQSYWGLQNLSGIPGQVGAAPIQNINAYGSAVAETITAVKVVNSMTGKVSRLQNHDCRFGYRESIFKQSEGKDLIVTEVEFSLSKENNFSSSYYSATQSINKQLEEKGITFPTPQSVREVVLATRKRIGMLEGMYQSAGSFFKNPIVSASEFKIIQQTIEQNFSEVSKNLAPWHWELPDGTIKLAAAFLMECTPYNKTAFKNEMYKGAVGISPLHTLSLINVHNATASDFKAFVQEIQKVVQDATGVDLEAEVQFV